MQAAALAVITAALVALPAASVITQALARVAAALQLAL